MNKFILKQSASLVFFGQSLQWVHSPFIVKRYYTGKIWRQQKISKKRRDKCLGGGTTVKPWWGTLLYDYFCHFWFFRHSQFPIFAIFTIYHFFFFIVIINFTIFSHLLLFTVPPLLFFVIFYCLQFLRVKKILCEVVNAQKNNC